MYTLLVDAEYTSPWAMSAFVALREKGAAFRMETVDLAAGEQHGETFQARALTRRVPTLLEGDAFALTESSAIAEFIDERHLGPRLYPLDPRQRARVRQVQAWLRSDLGPLRQERTTEVVFYRTQAAPLSPAGAAAADKLIAVAGRLIEPGQPSIAPQWSLADVDLALMLNRLAFHGDPLPEHLRAYAATQWSRPSVAEWVALPRPALG